MDVSLPEVLDQDVSPWTFYLDVSHPGHCAPGFFSMSVSTPAIPEQDVSSPDFFYQDVSHPDFSHQDFLDLDVSLSDFFYEDSDVLDILVPLLLNLRF